MPGKTARLRKRGADNVVGSIPSPLSGLTQLVEYITMAATVNRRGSNPLFKEKEDMSRLYQKVNDGN